MKRILVFLIPVLVIVLAFSFFIIYIYNSKVSILDEKLYIYVEPGTKRSEIEGIIELENMDMSSLAFKLYSKFYRYNNVFPGRYEVENGMKVGRLVRKLSRGRQTPLKLVIGKSRTKEEFVEKISKELAFSNQELYYIMNNNKFLSDFGVDSITALSLIIPNTYEVYWNIAVEEFIIKMYREGERFWEKRLEKIEEIGFTKLEIMTIASIVEEETNKNDEKPLVAGVYINRLKRGMPLQADPTVKYAIGDFSIKRILLNMLKVDSPYNTYKYAGLPPSPICMPSISSIDAVLNYARNDYIYFCAREDFSGYHNFATNFSDHNVNARKYHKALNKLKIK